MNPHAREFVPAHILRKRQEEANRLNELTEQLDQVELNETSKDKGSINQESSLSDNITSERVIRGEDISEVVSREGERTQNRTNNIKASEYETDTGDNLSTDPIYNEELQSLNDCEDDGYLLRAGENLCEFNGEQFIIPGDDEEEPPIETGYDFGNDEDNEDEDVCNAFEEFLGNLPDH